MPIITAAVGMSQDGHVNGGDDRHDHSFHLVLPQHDAARKSDLASQPCVALTSSYRLSSSRRSRLSVSI